MEEDKVLRSVIKYLIDGREGDAAKVLSACTLSYRYTNIYFQVEGEDKAYGVLIDLACPRVVYEILQNDTHPITDAIVAAIEACLPTNYFYENLTAHVEYADLEPSLLSELMVIALRRGIEMNLSEHQRLYLQTVFNYFHKHGKWPTYRQVEHALSGIYRDLDILEISQSLPSGFANSFAFSRKLSEEAILCLSAIHLCEGSEEDLTDFIKVLHFCVERYFGANEDEYTVEVVSGELSNQLSMEELTLRRVGLLIKDACEYPIYDSFGWTGDEYRGWKCSLSRNIRYFNGIVSIEQYLEKLYDLRKTSVVRSSNVTDIEASKNISLNNEQNEVSGDMEIIQRLLDESKNIERVVSSIQQGEEIGLSTEEINVLVEKYHVWYSKCLSVLPQDLKSRFRLEYEGSFWNAKIKKFLEAPTEPSLFRPQDEKGKEIFSYWAYPYKQNFYPHFLTQRQLLIEANKRLSSLESSAKIIDFEDLLSQSKELEKVASKIQQGEEIGLSTEEISRLVEMYHVWYSQCLSLLPEELNDKFRSEYEGTWYSLKIRKFLEAPTQINPLYTRSSSESELKLFSYWLYPYDTAFRIPFLRQKYLLIEARDGVSSVQRKGNSGSLEEYGIDTSYYPGKYKIKNDGSMQGQVIGEHVYATMKFGNSRKESEIPLQGSSDESDHSQVSDCQENKNDMRNSQSIRVNDSLFGQLILDLLQGLGFTNIEILHEDYGFDLQAIYPSISLTNVAIPQKWLVSIKHRNIPEFLKVTLLTRYITSLLSNPQTNQASKMLFIDYNNLTSFGKEYASALSKEFGGRVEIWDREQLENLLAQFPELQTKYEKTISKLPQSLSMSSQTDLMRIAEMLSKCRPGQEDWRKFEDICIDVLNKVFVPPLKRVEAQARTVSGLERRDALLPLLGAKNGWEQISQKYDAHFLLCEFKNYVHSIDKEEVNQTANYMKTHIGRLGIIFSRQSPSPSALNMRRSIYADRRKLILLFEDKHLIELLKLKEAGQNPLDLIHDAIHDFLLKYE